MSMQIDPSTTKYLIRAQLAADGVVEKPDVVGAIFGQTEGLLGDELDLRDLQKSGRIGRIEVEVDSKKGKSTGSIILPSSLDKVETAILAAALETIDRVGPCKAEIKVDGIEDVRVTKRQSVVDRARDLLQNLQEGGKDVGLDIADLVRDTIRVEEIVSYGQERLPAGPNVAKSDSIIVVEGRNDVVNLLKHGIKNAIAVEGTSVPKTIVDLCKEKTAIAFVDGDRGGELILKELLQTAEVDFIARAPRSREVEELTQKQIMKAMRNKIPGEQFAEMYSLNGKSENRDNVRGRGDRGGGRQDQDYAQPRQERKEERKEERGGRQRDERRERPERRERQGRPERQERREEKEQPAPAAAKGGREGKYVELLDELGGKLQAILLDEGLSPVGDKIAVRDLADTLKKESPGKVKQVVFDGVITQRLVDIAADKQIATLVGVKTGNITKRPDNVEVLTRAELA